MLLVNFILHLVRFRLSIKLLLIARFIGPVCTHHISFNYYKLISLNIYRYGFSKNLIESKYKHKKKLKLLTKT